MPELRRGRKGKNSEEMNIHSISEDIKNSDIEYCIREYVRPVEYREILSKHWFERMTISELAAEYHISDSAVKKIIYNLGDKILLRASKM